MAKVKRVKITTKTGLVNYAPISNKAHLERKNELYIKAKKPEDVLTLEVVEIEESELSFIEGSENKTHKPFDENFVPASKAAEKIKEVSSENQELKSENDDLKKKIAELEAKSKLAKEVLPKEPASKTAEKPAEPAVEKQAEAKK